MDVLGDAELSRDLDIHVIELPKTLELHLSDQTEPGPLHGWIRFFTEAQNWETLPPELKRPAMETAMSTVDVFRKDKHAYFIYMMREEENRVRRTQHAALEKEQAERLLWQERAEAEQGARLEAEARAEAEQGARVEAEARAEAQEARAEQLAQELRLLRAQLAGRPHDQD
jgi:hypothetical protein